MSQRIPERTDCDIHLFEWGDIYRAEKVRDAKRLMRYGQAEFEEDWNLAVALAILMARPNNNADFTNMLEDCWTRMHAYMANNPDARPWPEGESK